ncbi:MAG: protein phosphatase 2C domain-containing protein [Lachnospiraceae bacterium]|nr:protein phosphatase 2C domain-containing protein [Lachnospiraceae bacterium]
MLRNKKESEEGLFLDYLGTIVNVYSEKLEGKGEDAFVSLAVENGAMIGCLDGCGGIGSRRYAAFDSHTGAYVASRVAAQAASEWFLTGMEWGALSSLSEKALAALIQKALQACKGMEPVSSGLKGALTRDFPTTLTLALADLTSVFFYWAGDSRGYLLDKNGLHQMTADDVEQQDAMLNLLDDSPLKNVVSASKSFVIHKRKITLQNPGILLTCTDGCFGYLNSPMAFEWMLLDTMQLAKSPSEWEKLLKERMTAVAGDDFTLLAMVLGYSDFLHMKQDFGDRYAKMTSGFRQADSDRARMAWWSEYKTEYEKYKQL